jgi:HlyD family type I secretion membrane fusion protein
MTDSDNQEKINVQELQKFLMAAAASKAQTAQSNTTTPQPKLPKTFKEKFKDILQKSIQTFQKVALLSVHYIDRSINFIIKNDDPERNEILQYARPPIIFGAIVILIFIGIGGLWSVTAPLDSASHAMGTVISSSNRQQVQYSGSYPGIIKAIFIKQGDFIKAGAPIVEFDETQAKSNYETILNQYLNSLALESRLIAERDDLAEINFNELLSQYDTTEIKKLIEVQTNIFNSKKDYYEKSIASFKKEIEQYEKRIEAYNERKKSLLKNLNVTNDRLKSTNELLKEGFSSKSEAQKLEVSAAELKSNISTTESELASAEQEIAKTEIKIVNIKNQYVSEALKELKDIQVQRADLKEKLIMVEDNLKRIILKSPIDGFVNQIHFHTIGGVVPAGNLVAEITPSNEQLIVDAKIPAGNIDSVLVGQKAKLKFLAYKSRTSPTFIGTVVSISPDTVQDQQAAGSFAQHNKMMARAGDQFYNAKIEIDMQEFNKIAKKRNLKLIPGMMADIQIVTGTRTLFRYLIDPIADQAFKAFKER